MKFVINLFKGIFIGSGAILPGISSGVLCVVIGIYEDLLDRVLNFFKNPIENFKFFLPYVIGGAIGVFLVGKLLLFLFEHYYIATCLSFIGLIIGSIPSIIKQCSNNIHNKLLHWLLLLLSLTFSLYLIAIERSLCSPLNKAFTTSDLLTSGFFMSAGVVIPGVSSSVILMIMGLYETYLSAISNLNFLILIPMGIGLSFGGYLFLKLINVLFKYFRSYTYYTIVGFTIGSIFILFPAIYFSIETFIGISLFVLCFFISSRLEKLGKIQE